MPVLTRRRRFWDAAHVHITKKITRSFSTDRWLVCVLSARSLRNTHTYGVQSLMKLACVRPRKRLIRYIASWQEPMGAFESADL